MLSAARRHRVPVSAGARVRRPHHSPARRLVVAMLSVLVVAVVLSSMENAYAMWQDRASGDAGVVAAGTAGLSATWDGKHDETDWQNLLPGETAVQGLTLVNIGDVPLELSISESGIDAGFELRVASGPCGTEPLQTPAVGAPPQPLTAVDSSGAAVVLGAGETMEGCVAITATGALAPGTTMNFTLLVDGRQAA